MELLRFVYPEVFVLTVSLKVRVFSGSFNRTHFELVLHHFFNLAKKNLYVGLLSVFVFKRLFQLALNDKFWYLTILHIQTYFLSLDFGFLVFD